MTSVVVVVASISYISTWGLYLDSLSKMVMAAITDTIIEVAKESPVFLPLKACPPLLRSCPNVISYFKDDLSAEDMRRLDARSVGKSKGKTSLTGYIFRNPTFATVLEIEERDGTMNSSGYSGSVSANAAFYHICLGKWLSAFSKGYGAIRNGSSTPYVHGVKFVTLEEARYKKQVTINGKVEERVRVRTEEKDDRRIEEDGITREVLNSRNTSIFRPAGQTISNPQDIPDHLRFGLVFPYISGMLMPDPIFMFKFFAEMTLPNLLKKPLSFAERCTSIREAFSETSSTNQGMGFCHLCKGILMALDGRFDISPIIENDVYLGFLLYSSFEFYIIHNGEVVTAKDLVSVSEDIIEAFSSRRAVGRLAGLLNGCQLDDSEATTPFNKAIVEDEDLRSSTGVFFSIYNRLDNIEEGDKEQIKELFGEISLTPPQYLPFSPEMISLACKRVSEDEVWRADDSILDLFIPDEHFLFNARSSEVVMAAFGPLSFSLRAPGGRKYEFRGKRAMNYVTETHDVKSGQTRKGDVVTKKMRANNVIRFPRISFKDSAASLEISLREGWGTFIVSEKAPIPAATVEIRDLRKVDMIWDSLCAASRRIAGDVEVVKVPKTDAKSSGNGEPSPKKRRLLDESDE